MKNKVEALAIRAIKGEPDAVNTLFDIAKECEKKEHWEEAAIAYREMAFACRILASRSSSAAADVQRELDDMKGVKYIYEWWLEEHPDGMKTLPRPSSGIDSEFILTTVRFELSHDEKFNFVLFYLEETLTEMGVKFSSPGRSSLRVTCGLLGFVFGLQKDTPPYTELLQSNAVRVGLDLLANEIERRYTLKNQ